jgi:stage III sporulation protein SpoIIIAA
MPDGNSQEARSFFSILPRNIQHVWRQFAGYHFQTLQQIVIRIARLAVNPSLVG